MVDRRINAILCRFMKMILTALIPIIIVGWILNINVRYVLTVIGIVILSLLLTFLWEKVKSSDFIYYVFGTALGTLIIFLPKILDFCLNSVSDWNEVTIIVSIFSVLVAIITFIVTLSETKKRVEQDFKRNLRGKEADEFLNLIIDFMSHYDEVQKLTVSCLKMCENQIDLTQYEEKVKYHESYNRKIRERNRLISKLERDNIGLKIKKEQFNTKICSNSIFEDCDKIVKNINSLYNEGISQIAQNETGLKKLMLSYDKALQSDKTKIISSSNSVYEELTKI